MGKRFVNPIGRNKRCVWSITTKPFKEAHFATYPEGLIETPIKAGCPEFVCNKCGNVKEKIFGIKTAKNSWGDSKKKLRGYPKDGRCGDVYERTLIGYTDCGCNAGFSPGIVLDPFMGSGTTAVVAKKLGRNYLGIELNPEYVEIAEKRIAAYEKDQTLFD